MWAYASIPLQILLNSGYILLIHVDQGQTGGHSTPIKAMIILFQQLFLGLMVFVAVWPAQQFHWRGTLRFWWYFTWTRGRESWSMLIPALIIVGVNHLRFLSLPLVPVPVYAILNQSGMIMAALVSYFYLHRRYEARQWLGLCVLLAGIILVVLSSGEDHHHLSQHDFSGHADWHNEAGEPLAPEGTPALISSSELHADWVNRTTWLGPMVQVGATSPPQKDQAWPVPSTANTSLDLRFSYQQNQTLNGTFPEDPPETSSSSYVLGVLLLLVSELSSTIGQVYCESVFHNPLTLAEPDARRIQRLQARSPTLTFRQALHRSLHFDYQPSMILLLREGHLALWGLIVSLLLVWLGDYRRLLSEGPVQSFSWYTWSSALVGPLGLMVSYANIQRYGSVQRSIFNVISVILTCMLSVVWFNFQLTWWFGLGFGLVVIGLMLYFLPIGPSTVLSPRSSPEVGKPGPGLVRIRREIHATPSSL